MKITVAQLNPTVGDIQGNLQRAIHELARQSQVGSDLIVFPELFLVGYPPKDLLDRPWFIKKVQQAIAELVRISAGYPETGILIGAPVPTGRETGKGLANAAILIYRGQIILEQEKSLLPTYDIFDEARHFDPAVAIRVIPFKGETLGISICEDAWNEPDFWPKQQIYDFDPIGDLAAQGATILINISASPFHLGKDQLRFQMIRNHARKHQLPFVFVNQVGGNDEIIFDGGSMCLGAQGDLIWNGAFFEEHVQVIDMQQSARNADYQPLEQIESVYRALILGLKDYIRKCGFQKAVIGLSGGIDSALTASLAVAALGRENVLGITMHHLIHREEAYPISRNWLPIWVLCVMGLRSQTYSKHTLTN
jgi:NAD+ synthase (glutamine-hydrolysing)